MFESERLFIDRINKLSFTKGQNFGSLMWAKFCKLVVISRFLYVSFPLFYRFILGIPLLYWGLFTYLTYVLYVLWANWLDLHIWYCYSHNKFSIKIFIITNLRKLFLFIITIAYITTYTGKPYEGFCNIYALLMFFIAAGYTIPLFDKIIYNIDETK